MGDVASMAAGAVIAGIGGTTVANSIMNLEKNLNGADKYFEEISSSEVSIKDGNFKHLDKKYLKKQGINAEALKKEYVGTAGAHFDIYVDKNTGRLYLFQIRNNSVGLPTDEFI